MHIYLEASLDAYKGWEWKGGRWNKAKQGKLRLGELNLWKGVFSGSALWMVRLEV